ncbi:MAG: ABC transporter permease, partial [Chloroflexota bacterium]
VAVARREYLARARTRTFKLTTIVLVLAGLGVALAPILIRAVVGEGKQTQIEVVVGDSSPGVDVAASLAGALNAPLLPTGGAATNSTPQYRVTTVQDEAAARARVLAGDTAGLLVVDRPAAAGDLSFDYVSKQTQFDRLPQLVHQAVAAIAIQDRLATAGITPGDQATLFAPPDYRTSAADPNAPAGGDPTDQAGGFAIGFVLAIILFMAIVLYGQWIAYSVVEEKSSRVMEVILGAATPFELLSGKVVGVGALALTQYVIVFVPAVLALMLQSQIAGLLLGGAAAPAGLTAGLSIPLLLAFGVFFVLGFALYAVLYAGAASLVSRTEDINQIVAPMTLVAAAGYLVAVYSSTGLLDATSPVVVVMSFIPFFSPYLMLSRLGAGLAGPLDVIVAMALLAITVPLALWVAARFYAAGVLMYGQRPSLRLMLRVLRSGAR